MKIKLLLATLVALGVTAINSQAQSTDIVFTASAGYTNGNLVGQQNWTLGGGNTADWQVNTSGGGSATVSSNAVNYSSVNYALGTKLANGYKGFVDFSFTVGATNASALNVVAFSVADSSNSYHGPGFELKAQPGGQFSFDIYNTAALTGGWSSTANFAGSNLGVANTSGTGTSANLRFSFITTPAGGGTSWTTVLTLTNLTTGLQVGTTLTQNWTASSGQGLASHVNLAAGQLNTSTLSGSASVNQIAIGPNYYTLTYNAGANGTISGTTPQTVAYLSSGSTVTALATNANYSFTSWSDGVTAANRTDTALIGGTNVTANFTWNYTMPLVIGFPASAGYTNGNLVGQQNWTLGGGNTADWQVNTNGSGSATITSNAPNGSAVKYGMGTLTLSNGYSGLADFSFTVGATNASQQGVFYMDILDSTNANKGPNFEMHAQPGGGFQMDIYNTAAVSGGYTSTTFTGSSIGITNGIGTSANLRWNFTTAPAGGGTNWTTILTLSNLTTGTLVSTVTQHWTDATGQGLATTLYMADGAFNTTTLNGSLSVNQIAMGPIPVLAQTTVNGFTGTEGYTNGNLGGQKNWSASSAWQVNTNGNGYATVSSSAANYASVAYTLGWPLINGYSGLADFSFTVGATNASTQNVVIFTIQDSGNGNKGPALELKAQPGGLFSFDIYNNAALTGASVSTANFNGSNLGITNGTGISANLRFSFITTPAGGGTNWTTLLTLTNLTTGLQVGSVTQNWTDATGQGLATTLNMSSGALNTSTLSGSVSVDQIAIAPNSYKLTYNAGTGGTISGTTPQTVAYLSSGTTVTALATNANYSFSSWSDGVATANRTDTALTGGTNVTANFAWNYNAPIVDGFTATEGFTNGNLSGQNHWGSTAPTGWLVDTNGNGSAYASSSTVSFASVTNALGTPLTNGYSGLVDFSFTVGATNASQKEVVAFMIQDAANSYKGPAFELQAQPGGLFSFDIYNTAALTGGFVGTANFSGSSLGIPSSTGTSANLRFSFTTTPVGGGTSWTTVLTLTNLDTGLQVGSVTQNWTDATGPGWASVISMNDGALSTLSGSVSVDQFAIGPVGAILPAAPSTSTTTFISIENLGAGQFVLQWANGGTLQETTNLVTGSWQPVSGATSPYTNTLTGAQAFYRVHP